MRRNGLFFSLMALSVIVMAAFSGYRAPLYDGVGAPDEPYRYVQPPTPSLKTALPPSTITSSITPKDVADNNYVALVGQEFGPQASVFFYAASLNLPPNTTKITLAVTPLAPTGSRPSNGSIAGNVYRFSASSTSGPISYTPNPNNRGIIDLRLPQAYGTGATIDYRSQPNSKWTAYATNQVGNDIYEAAVIGLGDYALVVAKTTPNSASPSDISPLVIILAGFFVGAVAIILVVRHRSTKKHD